MKVLVLMQNDYPIGVYTDAESLQAASREHYERSYKYTNRPMEDFHYRSYEFTIGGVAD